MGKACVPADSDTLRCKVVSNDNVFYVNVSLCEYVVLIYSRVCGKELFSDHPHPAPPRAARRAPARVRWACLSNVVVEADSLSHTTLLKISTLEANQYIS